MKISPGIRKRFCEQALTDESERRDVSLKRPGHARKMTKVARTSKEKGKTGMQTPEANS